MFAALYSVLCILFVYCIKYIGDLFAKYSDFVFYFFVFFQSSIDFRSVNVLYTFHLCCVGRSLPSRMALQAIIITIYILLLVCFESVIYCNLYLVQK